MRTILFLIMSFSALSAEIVKQQINGAMCPSFCQCSRYNNRNYADCSAKNLISPNVEVSTLVEILDLSYNDITVLDQKSFKTYHNLIELFITHNAIHTINYDAFAKLLNVKTIDLSYNRIEELDARLLFRNIKLETLNLEGNQLRTLENKPLVFSTTLRSLNLRNTQINHVSARLFSGLPQLRQLDLSENLMITISATALSVAPRLQSVKLNSNAWNCDQSLNETVFEWRAQGIDVELQDCVGIGRAAGTTQLDLQQFERMRVAQNYEEIPEEETDAQWQVPQHNQEHDELDSIGDNHADYDNADNDDDEELFDADFDDKYKLLDEFSPTALRCAKSNHELCRVFRAQLEKLTLVMMGNNRRLFDENDACFKRNLQIYLIGLVTGFASMVYIVLTALCFHKCLKARSRREQQERVERIRRTQLAPSAPPLTLPRSPAARAIVVRRRPPVGMRHYHSNTPTVHQPQQQTQEQALSAKTRDNFLTRLFGRPARRQYYRTFNEETATLIRRLSSSNLFVNRRRSQHMNSSNSEQPRVADAPAHSTTVDIADEIVVHDVGASGAATPTRPETPPPDYSDIVVVATTAARHAKATRSIST